MQIVLANYIHPVGAIKPLCFKVRVVEEYPAKVVWQYDVAIHLHPPAVILKVVEPGVDRSAFVEVAVILGKKVGLHTRSTMLARAKLRLLVVVRCDDNQGIKMRVIVLQRHVKKIVKPDRDGDPFQTDVVAVVRLKFWAR